MKMLLLICTLNCFASAQSDTVALQLARVEGEFSKTAGVKGIKSAFLEYFDDECVIFGPRPTNGKPAIAADSDSRASLIWMPTVVEVSASGDFGYTTGPSEFHQENSAAEKGHYGHFVSVWRKKHNGRWKVILDVGSSYPKGAKREEQLRIRQLNPEGCTGGAKSGTDQSDLLAADSAYSAIAQSKGSIGALEGFGSGDVRLYRRGKFPAEGKKAGSVLVGQERFSGCKFSDGQMSSTGDLGFTYGLAVTANADTNNYIRVWRRDNEWKIVVDVLNPWVRKD